MPNDAHLAFLRAHIHVTAEKRVVVVALRLGLAHRGVGFFDQVWRGFSIIGLGANADAGADMQCLLGDLNGAGEGFTDFLSGACGVFL